MMEIRVTAHFRVRPGRAEAFREYATRLAEKVRGTKVGQTLTYQFYFRTDDATVCIAHEVFRDANAFAEHLANLTDEVVAASDLFEIARTEICGPLPAELVRRLQGQSAPGTSVHQFYGDLVASM